MTNNYPINRLMSLLHAYDAVPTHASFVEATIKPMVIADLTGFFSQAIHYGAHVTVHRFIHDAMAVFHDKQARRELPHIADLSIECPERNALDLQVKYHLMFSPRQIRIIDIPIRNVPIGDIDTMLQRAADRMDAIAHYARSQ